MTKLMSFFLIVFLLTAPGSANAADTLSASQIQHFINSMKDVRVLTNKMETEGKKEVMAAKVRPAPGEEFKPYTKAVSALKSEFPPEYGELGKIVKAHGFNSQENWAQTGNDVMHAYAAAQMKSSGHDASSMRASIPPEALAQMPPQARAQMEASMNMVKQFQKVPAENIAAIAPFTPQLEAMMNK